LLPADQLPTSRDNVLIRHAILRGVRPAERMQRLSRGVIGPPSPFLLPSAPPRGCCTDVETSGDVFGSSRRAEERARFAFNRRELRNRYIDTRSRAERLRERGIALPGILLRDTGIRTDGAERFSSAGLSAVGKLSQCRQGVVRECEGYLAGTFPARVGGRGTATANSGARE